MDRRTRPDFTRSGITCVIALAVTLCAGCGGNSYVSYSSGGAATSTTTTGTGFTAYATPSSSGYLVIGMMALLGFHMQTWSAELSRYGYVPAYTPPMEPSRGVNLQDCTKPIENSSANLQCR